jgi:SAM-dependent methyltransferase
VPSAEPERPLGEVFDTVAEDYDDVRSGYPGTLVDAALEHGGLGKGARVVEVGCGTGKLTELLVARGLHVDAVDPGARMIDVARRRSGDSPLVRFHVARFEDVSLPERTYDAVFSATAFHWIDPAIGWRKAASLLEPGGLLALLAHHDVADESTAALDAGFRELWRTYVPEQRPWPPATDAETLLAEAAERGGNVSELWDFVLGGRHDLAVPEAAELFEDARVVGEVETHDETAEDSVALIRTTSSYFRIDPERRPAFEDDIRRLFEPTGGRVSFPLMSLVATALRAAG